MTASELEELDLSWKPGTPQEPGKSPFELADYRVPGRFWLARFDFTDHENVKDEWYRVVQGQNQPKPETLDVTAWRSIVERKLNADRTGTDVFLPQDDHDSDSFGLSQVVAQPPFELGVLFVHGIGNHAVRETLVRWAEPIVKLWRDRGVQFSKRAAGTYSDDERHRIVRWVRTHQLRNRAPIDGISEVLEAFTPVTPRAAKPPEPNSKPEPIPKPPLNPPASGAPVTCCSSVKAEHTQFADTTPGVIASGALLRVSTVDTNAVLRESHVFFAEAYWTKETFPPTWSELYDWLTTAIPIAVWARLHRLVWTRPIEIETIASAANSRFEKFRVSVSRWLWRAQKWVLPGAYVFGALAGQITLSLIGLFGLLPIPWLHRGIRTLITALLGTLGQSYAMQTSPIRRSAIVSAVTAKLNLVSDFSHRVVVVSHSQGAEVCRRIFQDARRDKVRGWYTFGSGIAPLAMLHPRNVDSPGSRRAVSVSRWTLVLVATLLAIGAIDAIPGVNLGVLTLLSRVPLIGWALVFLFGNWLAIRATKKGGSFGPETILNLRLSLLPQWRDYFSSEDPVPGGSFIDRFGDTLKDFKGQQRRIFNTRISFFDHTSYWHNIEQFVAPLAMDLLCRLGGGGDREREDKTLLAADRRRDVRTWWNVVAWAVGFLSLVGSVAWVAFGPPHRSAVWAERARAVWTQGSGMFERPLWERVTLAWTSGLIGQILLDLRWPLVILLLLGGWWFLNRHFARKSEETLINDLAQAAMK